MNHKKIIWISSLLVPIAVAILYYTPNYNGETIDFLPLVNACINATVFIILIAALIAIKKKKRILHQRLMTTALCLSVIFLLCYVFHHATHESVSFGKEGLMKHLYYFILISHIMISAIIIPFVLITFSKGLQKKFDDHKKIARITLPLWLYVALTGVLVYIMISPYY